MTTSNRSYIVSATSTTSYASRRSRISDQSILEAAAYPHADSKDLLGWATELENLGWETRREARKRMTCGKWGREKERSVSPMWWLRRNGQGGYERIAPLDGRVERDERDRGRGRRSIAVGV